MSKRLCPNCHEDISNGGHFVPPSLGDDGFFACESFKLLKASVSSPEPAPAPTANGADPFIGDARRMLFINGEHDMERGCARADR